MNSELNPYYLKTFDDFYSLHSDIQGYLKDFFLEPDQKILIKATTGETIEALIKDWEDVEEDSLQWDQHYGHRHEPLSPSMASQETLTNILKLFNSALAILFRSDWGPYQEALFDSWIPIGVQRPSSEQDMIEVLNWPADCFLERTYTCTSDTLKVLESGLTLCTQSHDYILFWKPVPYSTIPLDQLAHFSPYDSCALNLWDDEQIKTALVEA